MTPKNKDPPTPPRSDWGEVRRVRLWQMGLTRAQGESAPPASVCRAITRPGRAGGHSGLQAVSGKETSEP